MAASRADGVAARPRLAPGFADPVHDAQRCFRAVMAAMAEPALAIPYACEIAPPAPLGPVMAAVALTLLDYETPFWLDPSLAAAPEVADFLRFHTGAPRAGTPEGADFALIADGAVLPELTVFAQGEADDPERGATLLVGVAALGAGAAPDPAPLTLAGPGISGVRRFAVAGLPADFARRLAANAAGFPLGVDLVLCAPAALAGLPRTTRPLEA